MSTSISVIGSTNIRVFPTTLRENADPSAKFTTEYNLTSLLNKLLDVEAFVTNAYSSKIITVNNNSYILDKIDFNIMGYFFSIRDLDIKDILTKNGNTGYINACITINQQQDPTSTNFTNWWQLQGNDTTVTNNYNGLTLSFSSTNTFRHRNDSQRGDSGYNLGELVSNVQMDENANTYTYTFTILHYNKISDSSYQITVPQESRIKFQTTYNGLHQSVAIDDGELTVSTTE